jgi:hypothetical protein
MPDSIGLTAIGAQPVARCLCEVKNGVDMQALQRANRFRVSRFNRIPKILASHGQREFLVFYARVG